MQHEIICNCYVNNDVLHELFFYLDTVIKNLTFRTKRCSCL